VWNPFKAIGGAIAKAAGGIGKAIGGGLSKAGGAMSRAGDKMSGKSSVAPVKESTPVAPVKESTPVASTKESTPVAPRQTKLPPPTVGPVSISGGAARDESVLGADSDQERNLLETIKEFEADIGTGGLSKDAKEFIDHPSLAAIFDKYAGSSGFTPEQWIGGMKTIPNIRISRIGDGIDIIFDANFEIDGYKLGNRHVHAGF
jgi:hypothetical protein